MYFLLIFSHLKEYQNFYWNINISLDYYATFVQQVGNLFYRKDYKIVLNHTFLQKFLLVMNGNKIAIG